VSGVIHRKFPEAIRFDPVRRQADVALSGDDAVEVIDLLGGEILRRIYLNPGDKPRDAALTLDGRTLLTANSGSDTVSFIDLSALAETARLPVGNGPQAIVLDRAGRRGYVLNALSNSITVIDVPGRQVVTTVRTESGRCEAFNRDGTRFVLHQGLIPPRLRSFSSRW
jgi:YVTN family beta-propeller protein